MNLWWSISLNAIIFSQTSSKSRVNVQVLRNNSFRMIYVLGSEDDFSDFVFVIMWNMRILYSLMFFLSWRTPTWVCFLLMIYNQLKHKWQANQHECLTVIGCVCGWFLTLKLFFTVFSEVFRSFFCRNNGLCMYLHTSSVLISLALIVIIEPIWFSILTDFCNGLGWFIIEFDVLCVLDWTDSESPFLLA
jgi:hypothetical protein